MYMQWKAGKKTLYKNIEGKMHIQLFLWARS